MILAVTVTLVFRGMRLVDEPGAPEPAPSGQRLWQFPKFWLHFKSTESLAKDARTSGWFSLVYVHPDTGDRCVPASIQSDQAFVELVSRDDAPEVLLRDYKQITAHIGEDVDEIWPDYQFPTVEALLAWPAVQEKMTVAEKELLMEAVLHSISEREQYDASTPGTDFLQDYWIRKPAMLVMISCLEAMGDPEFLAWYATRKDGDIFVYPFASKEDWDAILKFARASAAGQVSL